MAANSPPESMEQLIEDWLDSPPVHVLRFRTTRDGCERRVGLALREYRDESVKLFVAVTVTGGRHKID